MDQKRSSGIDSPPLNTAMFGDSSFSAVGDDEGVKTATSGWLKSEEIVFSRTQAGRFVNESLILGEATRLGVEGVASVAPRRGDNHSRHRPFPQSIDRAESLVGFTYLHQAGLLGEQLGERRCSRCNSIWTGIWVNGWN